MQTTFLFVLAVLLAVFFEFSTSPCLRRPPLGDASELSLIHVGKTGGATLLKALHGIFEIKKDFHLCRPSLEDVKDRPVMVTIREPIARTLSIWRWGKFKCSNRTDCFGSPHELFECFPFLNDYLEARGNLSNNNRASLSDSCLRFADSPEVPSTHWQFDHRWHLEKFDEDFLKEVFPVRQSNLVDDFVSFCLYFNFEREKCFNTKKRLTVIHTNTKSHTEPKDYYLSSEAREFLESELKEEIEMYNHLVNITNGKIETVLPQLKDFEEMISHGKIAKLFREGTREERRNKRREEKRREKIRMQMQKEREERQEERRRKVEEERLKREIERERKEKERMRKKFYILLFVFLVFVTLTFCLW